MAMVLMALLGLGFAVCGVVIGAVAFAPSNDEAVVAPTAQLPHDKQK